MEAANAVNTSKKQQYVERAFKHDGAPTDPEFYELVRRTVEKKITNLMVNYDYTLKRICGSCFWDELDSWQVIQAGMYMSHMVQTHQLDLEEGRKKGNTKTYYRP